MARPCARFSIASASCLRADPIALSTALRGTMATVVPLVLLRARRHRLSRRTGRACHLDGRCRRTLSDASRRDARAGAGRTPVAPSRERHRGALVACRARHGGDRHRLRSYPRAGAGRRFARHQYRGRLSRRPSGRRYGHAYCSLGIGLWRRRALDDLCRAEFLAASPVSPP